MKAEFLDFMVESKALFFGEFTLKSGRVSPYFVNAGNLVTNVAQLARLGEFYAEQVLQSGLKFDVLFGPAYKGIPLATATAVALSQKGLADLHVSFDRKERKDHGEGGSIIGYIPKQDDKVAIIEDVTSAGTSVRETIALLKEQNTGASVVALYISIDRTERGTGEPGKKSAVEQIKQDYGIQVYSVATAADIINYLETNAGANVPDAAKHAENMREYLVQWGC